MEKTSVVRYIAAKNEIAAVPKRKKTIALAVAVIADLAQAGMFPFFAEGVFSIPDDALDAVIALVLLLTLGFRWRLLFSLLIELTPGAALFPTWTAVVLSLPSAPDEAFEREKPRADETILVREK